MRNTRKFLVALVLVLTMLVSVFAVSASAITISSFSVAGGFNDWNVNANKTTTGTDGSYSVSVYLSVGTYEFKCVVNGGSWYSNGSTFTNTCSNISVTTNSNSNMKLKAENEGTYTFTYTTAQKLTITYTAPDCQHEWQPATCQVAKTCTKCGDVEGTTLVHHYTDGVCDYGCGATSEYVTVYVDNTANWAEVYCYTWYTSDNTVMYSAWPGEKMTQEEDGRWSYQIPDEYYSVIFSNGSGTQSADLVVPTGDAVIYDNTAKTWYAPHTHSYTVPATCMKAMSCECGAIDPNGSPAPHGSEVCSCTLVKFENASNWSKVYCYYCDKDWGMISAAWPGNQISAGDDGLYYCYLPAGTVNLIFNAGENQPQTDNLTVPTGEANIYNPSDKAWKAPHTHSWSEATCTEPQKCACGETQGEAKGHTEETVAGTAATCCTAGLTDGKKCSVCGAIIEEQTEIPATGEHTYGEGCTAVKPSTNPKFDATTDVTVGTDKDVIAEGTVYGEFFTIKGKVTQRVKSGAVYCVELEKKSAGAIVFTVDGSSAVTIYIASTGGTNVSILNVMDAEGNMILSKDASVEGTSYVAVTVYVEAGTYSIVNPSSDRNTRVQSVEVAPHEHNYESSTVEPTCTEAGATKYTCSVCARSYSEANGVAALGHTEVDVEGKAPTCVDTGLTAGKKCSVCGETLTAQTEIPATGEHTYVDGACSVCGAEEGHVHSYTDTVTAPTCTEKGYTTHTCSCGDTVVDTYVDALGHTEVDVEGKDATCTETGLTAGKKCSVCEAFTTKQEKVEILGHKFENAVCTVCGAAAPVGPNGVFVNVSDLEAGKTTDAELATGISAYAGLTIESNGKVIDGFKFTQRLKLGGAMKVNDGVAINYIKLVASNSGKLIVYAVGGNSSATDRFLQLATLVDGAFVVSAKTETYVDGAAIAKYEFTVPAAGTYYLGSDNSGINLYYIGFEPEIPECEHEYTYTCDAHCNKCGELTNPEAKHTIAHVEAKAPTCTENGNVEYWTCEVCGGCWTDEACTQNTNRLNVVVPATGHLYVYNFCYYCNGANPYFENNFVVVGTNKLVCNEYHLVADKENEHGKPYQFTLLTITEAGTYTFKSENNLGITVYTTPVTEDNADAFGTGGSGWLTYDVDGTVDLEAGVYYIGFVYFEGHGDYTLVVEKAPAQPEEPEQPEQPEQPETPVEELSWFDKVTQRQ